MFRRAIMIGAAAANASAGGGEEIPPPALATDDFEAFEDAEPIDTVAEWALAAGDMTADSGAIKSNSSGVLTAARRVTPEFAADQYAEVTLVNTTGGAAVIGPAVRVQSGSEEWYGLYWDASGTLYLFEAIAGVYTGIASTAKSYADGDKLRLEVTGTGASIRLAAKEDTGSGWVEVWSDQVPTEAFDSGQPGLTGYGQNAGTDLKAEAWEGGDL